jgi:hypothetical protein
VLGGIIGSYAMWQVSPSKNWAILAKPTAQFTGFLGR